MIPISQQIKVVRTLTKQASMARSIEEVTEIQITRELVLQSLLDDLRGELQPLGVFPALSYEALEFWIGEKEGLN